MMPCRKLCPAIGSVFSKFFPTAVLKTRCRVISRGICFHICNSLGSQPAAGTDFLEKNREASDGECFSN